ncbi:hypothetical protein ACFYS8_35540 [Kitasatospora sp. NPDC004615]|uniref:hypothetical protein n=1 Tax=Kitasatospora sp. NPDC004615 TaxID=3364017 RepID=UPI00369F1513
MVARGTARLLVGNSGEEPVELTVEPWSGAYWIPPGRTFAVVTPASGEDGSWRGTAGPHGLFGVDRRPDSVTVWPYGSCFQLTDGAGTAAGADWGRPERPPAC